MFCALLTSRYQVSVYRTNGPLVYVLCSFLFLKPGMYVPVKITFIYYSVYCILL